MDHSAGPLLCDYMEGLWFLCPNLFMLHNKLVWPETRCSLCLPQSASDVSAPGLTTVCSPAKWTTLLTPQAMQLNISFHLIIYYVIFLYNLIFYCFPYSQVIIPLWFESSFLIIAFSIVYELWCKDRVYRWSSKCLWMNSMFPDSVSIYHMTYIDTNSLCMLKMLANFRPTSLKYLSTIQLKSSSKEIGLRIQNMDDNF